MPTAAKDSGRPNPPGCVRSSAVRPWPSVADQIVMAKEGNRLGLTFHPELQEDPLIQSYFIELI